MRPTCEQILALDFVKKRLHLLKNPNTHMHMNDTLVDLEDINMLGTIKVPKNLA